MEQARHIRHVAGHHDDGHGLADGPAHAQDDGGGHAAAGGGNGHAEDRLQVGGTQGQGGLLIVRNADDGGQDHDRQDQDRRQQAGAGGKAKRLLDAGDQNDHAHQAVDHGGDARQQLHGGVDDGSHPGVGHLGQVDGGHEPHRHPDEHGPGGAVDRGQEEGQDAVGGVRGRGGPGLPQQELA